MFNSPPQRLAGVGGGVVGGGGGRVVGGTIAGASMDSKVHLNPLLVEL